MCVYTCILYIYTCILYIYIYIYIYNIYILWATFITSVYEDVIICLFGFQYFVFEYNQSAAVLFDKMITITVSNM